MYAIPALSLTAKQIDELNVCWNSVIHRVFGYHKWESVSAIVLGLSRLNVKHLIMLRKVKFYRHLLYDCDAFLCNVFLMFLLHNFSNDSVVKSVFRSRHNAVMLTCSLCYSVNCVMCILVYFICVYIVCCVCPSAIWRINVFINRNRLVVSVNRLAN